jgi:hypothetical protein
VLSNLPRDSENTGQETEVQRIEAAIREHGFCVIKEEEIKQLFVDGDGDIKRFVLLARLAHERKWSFEFQPQDGIVRIASLPKLGADGTEAGSNIVG